MSAREIVDRTRNDPSTVASEERRHRLDGGAGYGREYQYSHDYASDDPRRFEQRYLPANIDAEFYTPGLAGAELEIADRVRRRADFENPQILQRTGRFRVTTPGSPLRVAQLIAGRELKTAALEAERAPRAPAETPPNRAEILVL